MKNEVNPPHIQLAIMSREYVVSRAIQAIANLNIADQMSDKPITIEKLAKLTSTVPELLERVLNFLTVYKLFTKTSEGYALTPLSYPLREDHPFSIKDVLGMVDESWWEAFAHLETSLKTGVCAFEHQHGSDFFVYLNNAPEKKAKFKKGKAKLSTYDDKAITKAFNFNKFEHIINIGEEKTELSQIIRDSYPHLSMTTYPFKPNEANHCAEELFTNLPTGDAYLFKGVLHDFNDDTIKKILSAFRQHMKKNASLIIAEQVIPEDDLPHTNKTMDIIMMVLVGGRQRPLSNWQELIESTGFKLKNTVQTQGVFMVMEFQ